MGEHGRGAQILMSEFSSSGTRAGPAVGQSVEPSSYHTRGQGSNPTARSRDSLAYTQFRFGELIGIHSGPFSHLFKLTLGEYLVPYNPPEASRLCAREKGLDLSI